MRSCPKCRSTEYNNKSFALMINECGHSLCSKCVENLFVRLSAPCPTCGRTLKKTAFYEQLLDDATVAKEVHVRKKILKTCNLKEEDFEDLREYNDYLEQVEQFVHNMTDEIDVEQTQRELQEFKRRYEELITKNRTRRSKDEDWVQRLLDEEARSRERNAQTRLRDDGSQRRRTADDARAVIAELMTSDVPAEFIVNDKKRQQFVAKMEQQKQQQQQQQQQQQPTRAPRLHTTEISHAPIADGGQPYHYSVQPLDLQGPPLPLMTELAARGYLQHIRTASTWQLAGGYHESLGCYRAMTEAHCGLFC